MHIPRLPRAGRSILAALNRIPHPARVSREFVHEAVKLAPAGCLLHILRAHHRGSDVCRIRSHASYVQITGLGGRYEVVPDSWVAASTTVLAESTRTCAWRRCHRVILSTTKVNHSRWASNFNHAKHAYRLGGSHRDSSSIMTSEQDVGNTLYGACSI